MSDEFGNRVETNRMVSRIRTNKVDPFDGKRPMEAN
jgi:hypothetical protein